MIKIAKHVLFGIAAEYIELDDSAYPKKIEFHRAAEGAEIELGENVMWPVISLLEGPVGDAWLKKGKFNGLFVEFTYERGVKIQKHARFEWRVEDCYTFAKEAAHLPGLKPFCEALDAALTCWKSLPTPPVSLVLGRQCSEFLEGEDFA